MYKCYFAKYIFKLLLIISYVKYMHATHLKSFTQQHNIVYELFPLIFVILIILIFNLVEY